jgi:hypothetical protein
MNLQAEKLRLIEWLATIQDAQIIKQIIELKRQKSVADYEAELKPMTMDELKARVAASEADIAAGRVYDIEDVFKELG